VGTAIILSVLLAERWSCPLRIITRIHQPEPGNVGEILLANNIVWDRNIEFLFAYVLNNQAPIDVSSEDVFLTTSWWTTCSTLRSTPSEKIVYLLQEDERMFYPAGDERLRCQETMSNPEIHILVNSRLLYEHLVLDGFANLERRGLWFEPSVVDSVAIRPPALERSEKKNFFFYARPGNVRNLFCLGLEVIENALVEGVIDADEWRVFFVGKDLTKIRLNGNVEPTLIQNVKWSEYRKLINSMDLGLTLMYTPHPSYPPLDLAASGAVVVTNTYGIKRSLESYSANIICAPPTVADLTEALTRAVPLVSDIERRVHNRANDRIVRDWRISFKETLGYLSRELNIS
jgi:hypothetical protein